MFLTPTFRRFLAGIGRNASATNLVVNGSFTTNATGWVAEGAGTVVRSTAQDYAGGTASLLVTTAAADGAGAKNNAGTVIAPATAYTLSAWIKGTANDLARLYCNELDAGLGFLAHTREDVTLTGAWQRVSLTFTSNVAAATLDIFAGTQGAAIVFYLDGVQLQTGSAATGTIDTNGASLTGRTVRIGL